MIADWIDDELRNWAEWCRSGPLPHPMPPDHAASAEGLYIAPSDLGEPAEPRRPRPNHLRAEIVHSAYRHVLTDRERWVLVWHYVRPHPMSTVLRRLRITRREWDVSMRSARRCVGEAFREAPSALRT